MAYRLYHTEGFVLGSRLVGEANKIFKILTPDLGLVSCFAQGVRCEKSKLRYNLQNLRFVNLSLIRGRDYWRVVHAEIDQTFHRLYSDRQQKLFLSQAALFLRRLVQGEGENRDLFLDLKQASQLLEKQDPTGDQNFSVGVECLFILRALADLGYQINAAELNFFTDRHDWSSEIIHDLTKQRRTIVHFINNTLRETHL